jgi:hypothetical protein
VGAAEMRNQPFLVTSLAAIVPGADGLIGYEFLSRFAARFDFQHGRLDLAPNADAFNAAGTPVPFVFYGRQPQVSGSIDGIAGFFALDTGSPITTLTTPFVHAHGLFTKYHPQASFAIPGIGGVTHQYLARAHDITLGGVAFPGPIVTLTEMDSGAFAASSIAANVGDGLLRRFDVIFDYSGKRIVFVPDVPNVADAHPDTSGIILANRSNALLIALVFDGTAAAKAGLKAGGQIVTVNAQAVTGNDIDRVRGLFSGASGTVISVGLADGTIANVTLQQYL